MRAAKAVLVSGRSFLKSWATFFVGGDFLLGCTFIVPFCRGKCPYCDFYSLAGTPEGMDAYVAAVLRAMGPWGEKLRGREIATVYFGGGTPSLLGAERLVRLLQGVKEGFGPGPRGRRSPLEANPTQVDRAFFQGVREAGFDRLSMGLQSANEEELRLLGPGPTPPGSGAGRGGRPGRGVFQHLPGPDAGAARRVPGKIGARSIDFAAGAGVEHISSYILKVEPGTPFAGRGWKSPTMTVPWSSTSSPWRSWQSGAMGSTRSATSQSPAGRAATTCCTGAGEEYVGFGPGAHSFFGGRRFYYPRDLAGFLNGAGPVDDGPGGGFGEFAMVNLRLSRGLVRRTALARFGAQGGALFDRARERAKKIPGAAGAGGWGAQSPLPRRGFWSPTPCWWSCWGRSCKKRERNFPLSFFYPAFCWNSWG